MAYKANQKGEDMSKHTPTPWSIGITNNGADHINVWMGIVHVASVMKFVPTGESAEANAEFIVRACNSHDELVEALEAQEAAEKWIAENDETDPFFEPTYTNMLEAARMLRKAAIAKATGASQD